MSTVITVENLGKKYTLHHQQREQYTALRDVISNGVRNLSKKIFSPFTPHSSHLSASEDFWALKDVSFEVKQGDRIGIIGRNGAGKSTLLKILSRITEPTTGSVRIKGRVASLLEVGTGFHPELSGRENIFLNGAILGMGRAEIKKKFDEIVDFAEIEKFLDTPVKVFRHTTICILNIRIVKLNGGLVFPIMRRIYGPCVKTGNFIRKGAFTTGITRQF